MGIFYNLAERGTETQMRTLMMMNRIDVIIRSTKSGFIFPCFDQLQNAIAEMRNYGKDNDQDRYRYRRT